MPDNKTLSTPIIIVGGGPVGLMLALFLDRHGVKSTLFNAEETTRWHPKGNTHNSRTMEHYRRLGIADKLRSFGLPQDHPTDVAYLTRFNGWELARLRMPSEAEKKQFGADAPTTDQIPEPIFRANQMYVEKFLLDHVRGRPNITLRFGWRAEKFTEEADGVALRAERGSDGASENWRAQYLIGCDGGSSFVRRALGIRYHGYDTLEQAFLGGRMVSVYLRAPTLYRDILRDRRAWQYWIVNAELRTTVVALNGDDEFVMLAKSADPKVAPDISSFARIMQRCAGTDIPVEVLGHRPWTAGVALVAERFATGRVLLAGDAVHLFTPTGGFGMNTGIDDAANLSWKLAAMIQGWGGRKLLDSYETERKPIALRNTMAARELAKSVGDVKVSTEMEEESAAGDAARREAGGFLATFGEEFASIGVQLGARYDGSPIIVPDGAPPADNFVQYRPTSTPGGRAPHVWLAQPGKAGNSLFDRLGTGFTLLRLGDKMPDTTAIEVIAGTRGVPLKVVDVTEPVARDLYKRDLVLVRPDQHIAWRGNSLPADTDHLLRLVTGG